MRYSEDADLDTSGIDDARGGGGFGGFGGRGIAVGGGGLGIVGAVIFLLVQVLGGGSGNGTGQGAGFGGIGAGKAADQGTVQQDCHTGADANSSEECAVVADINSIQDYWGGVLGARYSPSNTVFFNGSVSTGCGNATSGTGPFYCPADKRVYIDLSFFSDLKTQFGAEGGLFVDAYVLAHEYGHHVQDLLGTESRVQQGVTGPSSGSVRLELQADCYAGVWADHATTTPTATGKPLITDVTPDDISRALDTASRIGDDYIQKNLGSGQVDRSTFTHGTSAQREKWFTTGYRSGNAAQCDTFGTDNLG